jgi:hypothetical protein
MSLRILFALLFLGVSTASAQIPRGNAVIAPKLKNRDYIIGERERIAQRILKPGDSLMIKVYAYVNERGETQMPEVKQSSGNVQADTAAMILVRRMQWQPAQNVRRGVMMTIPVMLVRK